MSNNNLLRVPAFAALRRGKACCVVLGLALVVPMVFKQSQAGVGPHSYTVVWTPGEYTNFVVVSDTDLRVPLAQWPTWLETDTTNFPFTADDPQRFFALYGTNKVTGEFAWGGEK